MQNWRSALTLDLHKWFSCKGKRMKDLLLRALKFYDGYLHRHKKLHRKACHTCSTIILPYSRCLITDQWLCRCCCRCRFLNSLSFSFNPACCFVLLSQWYGHPHSHIPSVLGIPSGESEPIASWEIPHIYEREPPPPNDLQFFLEVSYQALILHQKWPRHFV